MKDLTAAMQSAYAALTAVENDPPIVLDTSSLASVIPPKLITPAEPVLEIPVGKKIQRIPAGNLRLAQPDQQPLALQIASKLIGGKLWDGQSPIYIADAHQTLKQLRHLDEKSLTLFALEDFVQVGEISAARVESVETLTAGTTVHLLAGATDIDGDAVLFNTGRIVEIDASEQPARAWVESSDGEHDVWVSLDQIQPLTPHSRRLIS